MARLWLKSLGMAAAGAALLPVAGSLLYAAARVAPCDRTELTASIGASQDASTQRSALDRLTIVLVGDTGFNPTDAKVDAKGLRKGKQVMSFTETLAGISRDVDGDLAFINLETVVTDRNDLAPETKGKGAFHFRSHPAALKALIDAGFNLFSLANNHAFDYGAPGIEETLYHLAVANAELAIAYAGRFPGVYATVGFHPHDAAIVTDADWAEIVSLAADPKVVGIGETGLDYYRDRSPRPAQREVFLRHIELARAAGLPLVIHTRDADDDSLMLLAAHAADLTVVLH
jgi:hypothetical protein